MASVFLGVSHCDGQYRSKSGCSVKQLQSSSCTSCLHDVRKGCNLESPPLGFVKRGEPSWIARFERFESTRYFQGQWNALILFFLRLLNVLGFLCLRCPVQSSIQSSIQSGSDAHTRARGMVHDSGWRLVSDPWLIVTAWGPVSAAAVALGRALE